MITYTSRTTGGQLAGTGLYYLEKRQLIRVQFWRSSIIRAVSFSVPRNFTQTLSRVVHTANIVPVESRGDQ